MSESPNQKSTCAWVDEGYSRRLWGQLLRQRFPSRATLLTVRNGGYVIEMCEMGRRFWGAQCFAAGPGNSLDVVLAMYSAAGRRLREHILLRITEHAGQRMFQRLRTNSSEDLARTAVEALYTLLQDRALWPENTRQGTEAKIALPWGLFHLVADGGMWVAKTFIGR
jgi:hypothetical protein